MKKIGKIFGKKNKAGDVGSVVVVSVFLLLVSLSPTLVSSNNSDGLGDTGSPLMKVIVGWAMKCNGDPASGGSVSVSSSQGSRSGTVLPDGSWQVDISGSGPGDPDWPDGTSFTVTITHSDADGSFSGSKSGSVSGTVTNVGTVILNPSALSASAGASPLSGDAPLSVDFTGSASGGCKPYSWSWDFDGDGTSTEQNPSHTFNDEGTYVCTLTATDECSNSDDDTVTITVNPTLSCDAGGPYSGTVCDPVSFTGSASGGHPPYTYDWDFGDGSSHSSQQNPTHQYDNDGSYTATLTVTDGNSDTDVDTASVTISTPPVNADAHGPYSGTTCSCVQFSGSASDGCPPYSYSWMFGDGGTSTQQNPCYQYNNDGSYTATLTVTDSNSDTDDDTASVTISTPPVNADAHGPYYGVPDKPIQFTGSASDGCSPYSYYWTFGDSGTSTQKNPSHTYDHEDRYTVTLEVTDNEGDTDTDTTYADVTVDLTANAHGPYTGEPGELIQFTGSASGGSKPYSWHWDFGDTHSSDEQNPTHPYTNAGNYTVVLTVTDDESNTANDATWALIYSNNPPDAPTITGETDGEAGVEYEYTFSTIDPNDDDVYYYIEWGDGEFEDWFGPYDSGEEVTKSHTWDEEDTYIIRAKAKDIFDAEGDWATLEVEMPINQQVINPLLQMILERFPNAFPILRHLMGL